MFRDNIYIFYSVRNKSKSKRLSCIFCRMSRRLASRVEDGWRVAAGSKSYRHSATLRYGSAQKIYAKYSCEATKSNHRPRDDDDDEVDYCSTIHLYHLRENAKQGSIIEMLLKSGNILCSCISYQYILYHYHITIDLRRGSSIATLPWNWMCVLMNPRWSFLIQHTISNINFKMPILNIFNDNEK